MSDDCEVIHGKSSVSRNGTEAGILIKLLVCTGGRYQLMVVQCSTYMFTKDVVRFLREISELKNKNVRDD